MKPILRNLFMKKLTLERGVPIISASISWLTPVCLLFRSEPVARSTRASLFSLQLKSWSTRSSSIRMFRESA